MASHEDLRIEWSMLCQECSECWTVQDLQLAAELGKTLLERNKELETTLKQHQGIIEDQAQEIEYLTKQTTALREVNDSRLRVYEQLEISIQDLERLNQKFQAENVNDKKRIKSLTATIEALEIQREELQCALDEVSAQRKRQEQLMQQGKAVSVAATNTTPVSDRLNPLIIETTPDKSSGIILAHQNDISVNDEMVDLLGQLQELKTQRVKQKVKLKELEEHLAAVIQENTQLQEHLDLMQQEGRSLKNLQEEILALDEVKQGKRCRQCLRNTDDRQDLLDAEDGSSIANSLPNDTYCSFVTMQIEDVQSRTLPGLEDIVPHLQNLGDDSPYRTLVEKYEALLEVQRNPRLQTQKSNTLSLQEELQMSGDFNSFQGKDVESDQEVTESHPHDENQHGEVQKESDKPNRVNRSKVNKTFSTTPTDFSEAETSSSGFSDETSNKSTQTDVIRPVGSFLCSISDGSDCRFSIYDDASPVESRFRKKPEYRQLFREIYAVLKRAADEKSEGEQLPLLEDSTPVKEAPMVPPVTPIKEDMPDFSGQDKTPVPNHLEPVTPQQHGGNNAENSEMITPTREPMPLQPISKAEDETETTKDSSSSSSNTSTTNSTTTTTTEDGVILRALPRKTDQIEYLSIGISVKKKGGKRKNSPMKKVSVAVGTSPIAGSTLGFTSRVGGNSNGSSTYNRSRKNYCAGANGSSDIGNGCGGQFTHPRNVWYRTENPKSMVMAAKPLSYDSWAESPQQYYSPPSQEVAKLRQLEMSYAEALRQGVKKNRATNNVYHK